MGLGGKLVKKQQGLFIQSFGPALDSPSLVIRVSFYLPRWGVGLFQEGFISCFRGHRGGQSFLLHWLLHKQLEFKIIIMGTSLAVQWLRLNAFTGEGAGSVPG